jgi:hypothetical protein
MRIMAIIARYLFFNYMFTVFREYGVFVNNLCPVMATIAQGISGG